MIMSRLLLVLLALSGTAFAGLPSSLDALRAVAKEGQGNVAASSAWKQVAQAKADELPLLLAAMDGANPLAENWLRAAIGSIEERDPKALPLAALTKFVQDTKHSPTGRAVAFDILLRRAPEGAAKLTPQLIEDPSPQLRRHPVAKLTEQGEALLAKGDKEASAGLFQQALDSARDEDQIKPLAKHLRELSKPVDLPKHFGFLMHWKMIAPFNNADRKGFDEAYPPEQRLDLAASYPGKGEQAVWKDFISTDDYGKIDFNKPFGMLKEVVGYATTEFTSNKARDAEIRIGCKNGWKIWLNGEMVFGRDEYHRGAKLDQYKIPCHLKAGNNTLLVKCCQNEQKETWTVEWEFQLRICDATGTAILAAK